jgi:hypothetical protein
VVPVWTLELAAPPSDLALTAQCSGPCHRPEHWANSRARLQRSSAGPRRRGYPHLISAICSQTVSGTFRSVVPHTPRPPSVQEDESVGTGCHATVAPPGEARGARSCQLCCSRNAPISVCSTQRQHRCTSSSRQPAGATTAGVLDAQRTACAAALALQPLAAIRCERILSLAAARATRIARYVHSEPVVHALDATHACRRTSWVGVPAASTVLDVIGVIAHATWFRAGGRA